MWYLASLLFARPPRPDENTVLCETSQVLLEADGALEAYAKARAWGARRCVETAPGFDFIGIQQLKALAREGPPQDGDEIDGRVFESEDLWHRLGDLIPSREEMVAVYLEQTPNGKLEDVLSHEEKRVVRRILRESSGVRTQAEGA